MFEKIKEFYNKLINSISQKFKLLPIRRLETLDYKKLTDLMKEKGHLQEFEKDLEEFENIEKLMQNKTNLHGINHVVRVLFNAYALATLENVNEEDKKIILEAAKLHDIGRIHDGEDTKHGEEGAIKARWILKEKGFSNEEIEQICFLIKEHSLPREKNLDDINNLPVELRNKYKYTLNILKDADKLDRCRIGDLDIKRLSTDNAKRLVWLANENFEHNRFYYKDKNKMNLYSFDKENGEQILEQIKKENEDIEITLEDIEKNYSTYKFLQDENKIDWMGVYKKRVKENIQLEEFLNIISNISSEDMEYLQDRFYSNKTTIIEAINTMGINKFLKLKENNELDMLMNIDNMKGSDLLKISPEKRNLLMEAAKWQGKPGQKYFYLYYSFVSNNEEDAINMLIQAEKEEHEYANRLRGGSNGYKLSKSLMHLPTRMKMILIKNTDREKVMNIREKTNVPLNIVLLGLVELDLLDNDLKIKDYEIKDIEKILINYDRLYLNVHTKKDKEQIRTLLVDLPDELTEEEMELIKKCTVGNLKRFKLNNFEQVKNYNEICDRKILEEFENTDNVEELRSLILETKINNVKNLKRDIYYYQKYLGENSKEIETVNLFNELFKTEDKETLLNVYNKINNSKDEFEFDGILDNIRDELKNISRQDVVEQMSNMQAKICVMDKVERDGTNVIDLTGTDFNLLISVIGSMGSPYLVELYNKQVRAYNKYLESKAYPLIKKKLDFEKEYKLKKMVKKRFKLDPMKNKQRCLSSIDQDFIGHIPSEEFGKEKQPDERLILAYFPENENDIYWMGNNDLMTSYDKERSDPTRKRVPHKDNFEDLCNLKLKDLNNLTMGNDNEIIVDSLPGAVICFDNVSNIAKKTAKKHNIPLLYIDTIEQFKIMQSKIYSYYDELKENISNVKVVSDEMFERAFNDIAKENNIVHRAFKMVHGFCYLDDDKFPKKEVVEIVERMKDLTREYIAKCDDTQKEKIQEIIDEEADINLLRYSYNVSKFIDMDEFDDFVKKSQKQEAEHIK